MPSWRPERVAEMVHRELALRLRTEIKDPELTEVSLTHVVMTRDLSRATVHFLPLGGGDVADTLLEALHRAGRRLRGPIGRALRLRTAPDIVFVVDTHTDQAVHLTSLLEKLRRERQQGGEE